MLKCIVPEDYEIGRRVAAARRRKGLTQNELAAALNVRDSVIKRLELGRRLIPSPMLAAIAAKLGVSPAYLLTGAPEADPLQPDERDLVRNYRALSPESRRGIARQAAIQAQQEARTC